jgi:trehalose 6-phosphate phosphatase
MTTGGDRSNRVIHFFDFDGTSAYITWPPHAAVLAPGMAEGLEGLVRSGADVVFVSGRPLEFLEEQLRGVSGVTLYGAYGLQRRGADGTVRVDERLAPLQPAIDAALAAARGSKTTQRSGVYVEEKGFGFGVHLRGMSQDARTRWDPEIRAELRRIAQEHGLTLLQGKLSYELRAPIDVHKEDVVEEVVGDAGAADIYIWGDDSGDANAFLKVAQLERQGRVRRGYRVLAASDETPDDVRRAANRLVEGPDGVVEAIERLARGEPVVDATRAVDK